MFFSESHLRSFGANPCLVHEGRVSTYAEVAELAKAAARELPAEQQLIAIEMTQTPAAIARYLGTLDAGHAVIPIMTGHEELLALAVKRFRPGPAGRRETAFTS
ncbi:D-alanine--poly(phosphoribitol) ligase [Devosia aurantiaca]|uniref:D-alanine--poly(Phosphoribitol) ligase n=1 Tax=Devosia aurantiaca TaxID=2714858 RepID=A0A6M1SH37_9HYPH|nr:D-alanine--poly(phosphoribitol) ligase [Devosia aurantiaca]NGP19149.1 D-alanine--poly(phosphoribitol) ligase [Devosia aurantiaca]